MSLTEYYIDANFLVDFFIPDELINTNTDSRRWKQNAHQLYQNIVNEPQSKLMISYETMLEAIGVLGRKMYEHVRRTTSASNNVLRTKMVNLLMTITKWEQSGKKSGKIVQKSPGSVDEKLYERALIFAKPIQ